MKLIWDRIGKWRKIFCKRFGMGKFDGKIGGWKIKFEGNYQGNFEGKLTEVWRSFPIKFEGNF